MSCFRICVVLVSVIALGCSEPPASDDGGGAMDARPDASSGDDDGGGAMDARSDAFSGDGSEPIGCDGDHCSCADDLSCDPGEYCDAGACVPVLAQGVACVRDGQCESARCADGVCCDRACASRCEACSAALRGGGGVDGTCGPVAAGEDPDAECAETPAEGCGTDGSCDGAGSCREWEASTVCADATCVSGVATTARTCSGSGDCGASTTTPCAPYACDATECRTTCTGDTDCAAGARCSGSVCVAALANGAVCTSAVQCTSGLCVDGVCCDGTCTGTCQACNVPGSLGACGIVSTVYDYGTCEPPMQCTASGACRRQQGSTCTLGTECATGLCIDGYCCNDACVGTCIACDNVGERGRCSIVHPGMDPDDECPGAATCSGLGPSCM